MNKSESYLDYLKSFVTNNISNNWNKILHDGYMDKGSNNNELSARSFDISIANKIKKTSKNLELELYVKGSLGHGVYSSNPWLRRTSM